MVITEKLSRPTAMVAAGFLLLASLLPLLVSQKAHAYALVSSREIKMSSSAANATGVTYRVTYTAATSHTVKGIVVDFCAGTSSPIIGDTCSAPAAFDVGTPTVSLVSGISGGTWASGAASANSGRTLVLTDSTGNAMTAGSTVVSFDVTTVHNPSTTGTFYARILTYSNASGGNDPSVYTATANGTDTTGVIDAGGIALSTANTITITSKVQERLTFCVYTSAVNTSDCSGVTGSTVTLGDTNGVLSDAGPYVDKTAKYNVSTNASNGVTIRAKGATLKTTPGCSNASNQTCSINAIGASAASSSAGTEQFGFCTYRDAGSATGLTPAAPYDDSNCSSTTQTAGTGSTGGVGTAQFGFDTSTAGDNITTTFGDTIATKSAGLISSAYVAMVGNISTTTEPGIYTATLNFIATGNY